MWRTHIAPLVLLAPIVLENGSTRSSILNLINYMYRKVWTFISFHIIFLLHTNTFLKVTYHKAKHTLKHNARSKWFHPFSTNEDWTALFTANIRRKQSDQTSETAINLLLKEQSDQGWSCLSFLFQHFNTISGSPISTCSHFSKYWNKLWCRNI